MTTTPEEAIVETLTGVVADPAGLARHLDLAKFTSVDGQPNIDALDDLRRDLTAAPNPGSPDGGRRGTSPGAQITREELKAMSPEQIVQAKDAGLLNCLLGSP